jgi:hypothetical protein
MLAPIQVLAICYGNDPIARLNRPAAPLNLPGPAVRRLLKEIKDGFLRRQNGFRSTVKIGGLPALDLEWIAAGQTAGVGVWSTRSKDEQKRIAGCVTLLLCGLDESRERGDVLAALASRRLPVPPDINARLDKDTRRPLLVNIHYSLSSLFDPVFATVSTMLASTFFGLLGAIAEVEQQEGD